MLRYAPKPQTAKPDPWQDLANAVIVQAAKDYRTSLRRLRRKPKSRTALDEIADLEEFFRSDWYRILTNVDGELLMRLIKEE